MPFIKTVAFSSFFLVAMAVLLLSGASSAQQSLKCLQIGGGGAQWNNTTSHVFLAQGYPASLNISNVLFVDNTSGRVGIGTASPGQKLDVAGYVKGQSGLCIANDCRTGWPATGITSESDPTVPASVKDGISWGEVGGKPGWDCGAGVAVQSLNLATGAVNCISVSSGGGITGSGTANYLSKWTGGASLGNSIISDDGNRVYIGTSSMSGKLSVASGSEYAVSAQFTNRGVTSGAGVYGDGWGSNTGIVGVSETGNGVYGTTSGNSASGVYGNSLGGSNGAAGTSSWGNGVYAASGSGNGVYAVSNTGYGVYGQTNGDSAVYGNNLGSGAGGHNGVAGTSINGYGVYARSTNNWGIYCDGTACGGTRAWTSSSDERLKKDITTIESALEKVGALRGVSFVWKNDTAGKRDIGFVAQEAKDVVPEVVSQDANGYYTMQTGQLTAILVEAIKEQQKQIENLTVQNAGQQQEINLLKEKIGSLMSR